MLRLRKCIVFNQFRTCLFVCRTQLFLFPSGTSQAVELLEIPKKTLHRFMKTLRCRFHRPSLSPPARLSIISCRNLRLCQWKLPVQLRFPLAIATNSWPWHLPLFLWPNLLWLRQCQMAILRLLFPTLPCLLDPTGRGLWRTASLSKFVATLRQWECTILPFDFLSLRLYWLYFQKQKTLNAGTSNLSTNGDRQA